MQTKKCRQCKKEKPLYEFYKQVLGKYGKGTICRICNTKIHKQYVKNNYRHLYLITKKWRKKNKARIARQKKLYCRIHSKDCVQATIMWRNNNRLKYLHYHKKYRQSTAYKFMVYKVSAKKRGYAFNLSFKQFKTFWQKPCSYCGDAIETIGLDRIDNRYGYSLKNVQSCCIKCNTLKYNMSHSNFLNRIKQIAKFQVAGKN